MTYPDNCIRGIPNDNFMYEDGSVGSHLFYFKERDQRDDGWTEQSINWEDDSSAIKLLLNQRKENGELQFRIGLVRIPREEIDRLSQRPTVNGVLDYERQPLENNPYHGNLLIRSDVSKPAMKKIAAGLALAISEVVYRSEK